MLELHCNSSNHELQSVSLILTQQLTSPKLLILLEKWERERVDSALGFSLKVYE